MNQIPKIIHYCWVGPNPKPASVLYCIESWKKHCPDYEIREWNESNYDFSQCNYMREAYEAKKWGFVPDYARLDIVYKYGGFYLDTDVELLKSLDELCSAGVVMGFENTGDGEYFVNCGHGFGAVPHHKLIGELRNVYDNISFINEDGTYNQLPSPHYTTDILERFGLKRKNETQSIRDLIVYKSDVLCPKNFRTGKVLITKNTVSIHHFTASWLDETIKKQLESRRKLEKMFGKRGASSLLYMKSIWEKYKGIKMFIVLPQRALEKLKGYLVSAKDEFSFYLELIIAMIRKNGTGSSVILDTSMQSDNVGDAIIMENCMKSLREFWNVDAMSHIATHSSPTDKDLDLLRKAKYKVLCGTNILSGRMRSYRLWKLDAKIAPYKSTILMGVGFDSSSADSDFYTRKMLHCILSGKYIHSVRDSFAEHKLKEMGIPNVINTGCPTMWGLTPEHCASIPQNKATDVVCTITDYNQDSKIDKMMIDILQRNYRRVYLWLQGSGDLEYVKLLGIEDSVTLVDSTLEAYDKIMALPDLDYVGTRLHAGIRALAFGHRSIIVSIDNRASSIAKDTNLPVLDREHISQELEKRVCGEFETKIKLPVENIMKWKNQFRECVSQ